MCLEPAVGRKAGVISPTLRMSAFATCWTCGLPSKCNRACSDQARWFVTATILSCRSHTRKTRSCVDGARETAGTTRVSRRTCTSGPKNFDNLVHGPLPEVLFGPPMRMGLGTRRCATHDTRDGFSWCSVSSDHYVRSIQSRFLFDLAKSGLGLTG